MKQFYIILIFVSAFSTNSATAQSKIDGYIITNANDTIKSIFSVAKKRKIERRNNLAFAEVIKKDTLMRLTSKDIIGYKKGDSFYKSFKIDAKDTTFFGRLITSGKVTLYYSNVYGGKYYFKKKRERNFYELDSTSESVVTSTAETSGSYIDYQGVINPQMPNIKSSDNAYRDFFVQYFNDHQPIVNKLRQGFHTYSSIESMFKEYNQ
jgi:hypothetical protein